MTVRFFVMVFNIVVIKKMKKTCAVVVILMLVMGKMFKKNRQPQHFFSKCIITEELERKEYDN